MRSHGPFTVGVTPRDAVKAAVLTEDAARTVHLARQLGTPVDLPPDLVDRLYDRYQHVYGQAGDDRRGTAHDATQQPEELR
jgi:L-ribulose-5-phosphate 4-epimerase